MPCWEPLEGQPLLLHPERLATLIVHGAADMTAAALRLLWRHGVQLSFLSRAGNRLLGRVSPPADRAPALACWQHWAVSDPQFTLTQARRLVQAKIQGMQQVAGHFAKLGQPSLRSLQHELDNDLKRPLTANSLASLRGHEGAASARWHAAMRCLFPPSLPYAGRQHHPPPDPVNALLSLGYTLLLTRIQAEIAAVGLDPLVGVYHQPRPGKPALACDLIEPFRAPLVDQLIVGQVRQGCFRREHFQDTAKGIRLNRDDFRRFLKAFEDRFHAASSGISFEVQIRQTVERFAAAVRQWMESQHGAVDGP
jgi:CRISPR-associated protein Cas1